MRRSHAHFGTGRPFLCLSLRGLQASGFRFLAWEPNARSQKPEVKRLATALRHEGDHRVAIEREVLLEHVLQNLRRDRIYPLVARDDVCEVAAEHMDGAHPAQPVS